MCSNIYLLFVRLHYMSVYGTRCGIEYIRPLIPHGDSINYEENACCTRYEEENIPSVHEFVKLFRVERNLCVVAVKVKCCLK